MKALIVKPHWGNLILNGEKSWEIRGSNTTLRGLIEIIFSKSGEVKGSVVLVDSSPLTKQEFEQNRDLHKITCSYEELPYKHPYRWVFRDATKYEKPRPYKHPQGAVIWVNIQGGKQLVEVSKHAMKRLSERSGLSKKAALRIATKAFEDGITHSNTKGNLNKYVTSLYFNNRSANNIRLYGDKAFIFAGETLVTVLQIPSNLTKDMKKLTK